MLSVIIPIYNSENTLNRCIESVMLQEVNDMEVILVDDGSSDGSPDICDAWEKRDKRIRVIHKENGGLSDARNAGIDVCKGDILTFVDSDDEIAPHTYNLLYDFMNSNPDCDILEYPIKLFGGRRKPELVLSNNIFPIFTMQEKRDYWIREKAYIHSFVCNKFFRHHLFEELRFPKNRHFEDLWLLPSLLLKASVIATLNIGCYIYIQNEKSITHKYTNIEQLLEAQMKALKELDINVNVSSILYSELLNVQIDAYRFAITPGKILLPYHKFSLCELNNLKMCLKMLVQNMFGIEFLCRVYRFAYIISKRT